MSNKGLTTRDVSAKLPASFPELVFSGASEAQEGVCLVRGRKEKLAAFEVASAFFVQAESELNK